MMGTDHGIRVIRWYFVGAHFVKISCRLIFAQLVQNLACTKIALV